MGWGGALELVESIVLTVLPKRVKKKMTRMHCSSNRLIRMTTFDAPTTNKYQGNITYIWHVYVQK